MRASALQATRGSSGSQASPPPSASRGNGHWPLRGAEVAGVQPSAQGQLVLHASDGLPGRQELQTGAWTQRSLAASPSHPTSPCSRPGTLPAGLPEPLPEALQRGPHPKVASFRQRKQLGVGGQVEVWCAGRTAHSPAADLGRFPKALGRPALPSPRWPASRGRLAPSVFLGGPSQEASQAVSIRRTPALNSRTIWAIFAQNK